MKFLLSAALIIILVASAQSQDLSTASTLFPRTDAAMALASAGITTPGVVGQNAETTTSSSASLGLSPGQAALKSALLPGWGQYYAGSNTKAIMFASLEVVGWAAMIYYYQDGMDRDSEFKKYADSHFSEQVYRNEEYRIAHEVGTQAYGLYGGSQTGWDSLSWDEKQKYLASEGSFTHELPNAQERRDNATDKQQYYEMIGKYIHQFGFGWDDVFQVDAGGNVIPGAYRGDDRATVFYDDVSKAARKSVYYMWMRGLSNRSLENSSRALQMIMLNHVASVLDAVFTVRAMDRDIEAKVGARAVMQNDHPMAVVGLNLKW